MPNYKASQLKGSNRCYERRSRDITLDGSKNIVYKKVGIMKSAIKNFFLAKELKENDVKRIYSDYIVKGLHKEDVEESDLDTYLKVVSVLIGLDSPIDSYTPDEAWKEIRAFADFSRIDKFVTEAYDRLGFLTSETAKAQSIVAVMQIIRYLKFEKRTPIIPMEEKTFDIYGITVDVRPDLIFEDGRGGYEAVKICCRTPNVTQSGSKVDGSVSTSLELYAFWRYVRELAEDASPHQMSASYYFLRRKDDKDDEFQQEFTGSGGYNIVSLSDIVRKGEESDIDKLFKDQFAEFKKGEQCSGKTCETCDFRMLCEYNKAPLASEREKSKKSIDDIKLSSEQEEAIYFRDGVCRINAGAGSGKTMVVAYRTALMLSEGISPEDILMITFTDAGAQEMRERIAMYDADLGTNSDLDALCCLTFNAFGQIVVEEKYSEFGFKDTPRVINDIERKDIIRDVLNRNVVEGLNYKEFDFAPKGALPVVSECFKTIKRDRLSLYDVEELQKALPESVSKWITKDSAYGKILELYVEFNNILKDSCLLEFADQEVLLFDYLEKDPYYLDKWGFKHIIVDEFQDSSERQIEIIKKFLEVKTFESLMVVGDDSQSIYGFRDAVVDNITKFEEKIGRKVKDINMLINYRSTPEILDYANKMNAYNQNRVEKDLIASRPSGKKPVVKGFFDQKAEYDYIVSVVKDAIKRGESPDEIAILAATRSELLKIAGYLTDSGIESIMMAPEPLLENSRIQGVIALCNLLEDPNSTEDIVVYENCLEDGLILLRDDDDIKNIIKKRQEKVQEFRELTSSSKYTKFMELAEDLIDGDELCESFINDLKRFYSYEDVIDYVKKFVELGGDKVKRMKKYSGVVLSTAHSSKGLEWNIVITTITKFPRRIMKVDDCEERRRLLFVSATRARNELYITGQYRIGIKKKNPDFNGFLRESMEVMGLPYDPVDPNEEKKIYVNSNKARMRERARRIEGQTEIKL